MENKILGEKLDFKNPFCIYGFILLILGVVLGGAIGAGVGVLCGLIIIQIGNNTKVSIRKKVILTIAITLGGMFAYTTIASLFLSLFQ